MTDALIGIAGFAGAGKDTVADLMVAHYGFDKIAFADTMRRMIEAIDPVVGYSPLEDGDFEVIRYNDAIEFVGYNDAKVMYPEIRQFLQRLGTEAGREVFGDNIWADMAMKRAATMKRVVIADTRFRNEAEAIKANGGIVIRVTRPGVDATNGHVSEHDLDGWRYDAHIHNNGTLSDLMVKAEAVFAKTIPGVLRIS